MFVNLFSSVGRENCNARWLERGVGGERGSRGSIFGESWELEIGIRCSTSLSYYGFLYPYVLQKNLHISPPLPFTRFNFVYTSLLLTTPLLPFSCLSTPTRSRIFDQLGRRQGQYLFPILTDTKSRSISEVNFQAKNARISEYPTLQGGRGRKNTLKAKGPGMERNEPFASPLRLGVS